ncbi:hypothetical protein FACS189429_3270 [Bacteroidia bacterium]|nr:hypothetical protein FACS189429_3270 [Bacteroidia bacterium]GHV44657.1 hypothetical protein FACS1894180_6260 [Bacteroidia bacterium]
MKIKSFIVLSLIVTFSVNIFAQDDKKSPLTFSYEVGYANQLRNGKEFAKLNIEGLRMGALVKYSFTSRVFGQTGLLYEYLHYSHTQSYHSGAGNFRQSTAANQLNLPLLVGYQIPLFSQVKFFAYGGPTVRFGLSESLLTATTYPTDSTAKANLTALLKEEGLYRTDGFSNMYKDKELQRFSVLLSLGAGFEWSRFYLKGGYDFGLTNINAQNKKRLTQGGWFVSLGYNF